MYQSLTHFHWEPLYALGSVEKRTEGEWEREKEERQVGRKKLPREPGPDSAGRVI